MPENWSAAYPAEAVGVTTATTTDNTRLHRRQAPPRAHPHPPTLLRDRSGGELCLRLDDGSVVETDLVVDGREVGGDRGEVRQDAFAVRAQQLEPGELVPVAGAHQAGVPTDVADRH